MKSRILSIAVISLFVSACADMNTAKQATRDGDLTKARANYEALAKAGYPDAQTELGIMLVRGEGGLADVTRGDAMLKEAGDKNIPKALFERGKLYEDGKLVQKNSELAQQLYERALSLGYTRAKYNLATLYEENGNYLMAEQLYKQSLNDKNYKAAARLGDLYAKGKGREPNLATALAWYYYAQMREVEGLEKNIVKLENKLTSDQISYAKQRAQG
jgi:TPR repeat protein